MKWEYMSVTLTGSLGFLAPTGQVDVGKMTSELNRLGAEGWELAVGFDTNTSGGQTGEVVLLLKRARVS